MKEHTTITICKKWSRPEIMMTVNDELIEIKMRLVDFTDVLKREIGKVTWVFTEKEFAKRFEAAVEAAIKAMKDETRKVV